MCDALTDPDGAACDVAALVLRVAELGHDDLGAVVAIATSTDALRWVVDDISEPELRVATTQLLDEVDDELAWTPVVPRAAAAAEQMAAHPRCAVAAER